MPSCPWSNSLPQNCVSHLLVIALIAAKGNWDIVGLVRSNTMHYRCSFIRKWMIVCALIKQAISMNYVISGWWQWKNMEMQSERLIKWEFCAFWSLSVINLSNTQNVPGLDFIYAVVCDSAEKEFHTIFVFSKWVDKERRMALRPTKNLFSFFMC